MTRRAVFFVLALVVAAGVVWLLVYAAEPDTYYAPTELTRWDHARKDNAWVLFAASIALGVASVVGLLARAAGKAGRLDSAVVALTVVALVSFPVAWVAVTIGH